MAREIKSIRDSSGKLQFKPDEWRTAQQISNFFAKMSALQRQRQADEIESQEEEQELLGKLSSLKLAQLREVCRALSLQTNGSNSRKRTFTEPLDAYAVLMSEITEFCTTYSSFAFYKIHCWDLSVVIELSCEK